MANAQPEMTNTDAAPERDRAATPGRAGFTARLSVHRTAITGAIAFAAAMLVYCHTMISGLCFLDNGEFQTVTYVLGIAHPTGYPLFVIVGKIFGTLVPIGEWAFRMNLMSVACVAAAVAILAILAVRFGASPAIAVAAALAFGFALDVWKASGHADPYTLTLLIGAVLWLLALKWAKTGKRRWLWTLALSSGVGLGSAAVLAMELPALVIYAIVAQPRKFFRPVTVIAAGFLGLFGVAGIYAFLPIRARMNPPLNYGDPRTWKAFRAVAMGAGVGETKDFLTWHGPIDALRNLHYVLHWHREWMTLPGAVAIGVFALIGLAVLFRRDWRFGLGVTLGILIPSYAASVWWANDIGNYFLIPNWLALIAAAVGVQAAVIDQIGRLRARYLHRAVYLLAIVAVFWVPFHMFRINSRNGDIARMRGYRDGDILVRKVFSTVKPHAVIFSWWGPSTALWYGKFVDKLRPDVEIIDDTNLAAHGWTDATEGMAHYFGKRPIYTTPAGDEYQRYSRRFHMHLAADLGVFGQNLYEVDSKIDLSRRKLGDGIVYVSTQPLAMGAKKLALKWPPSVRPGQLAVADVLSYSGAKPSITPPPGWTLIREDSSLPTRQSIYWHVVQSNDSAMHTWTFSAPVAAQGAMLVFDRGATIDPIDGSSGNIGDGWQLAAKPIATKHDGDFIVVFYATDFHGDEPGHERPAGMKPLVEVVKPSHEYWIFGASQSRKGAYGPVLCRGGQAFHWTAALVAIRRAGAGH
ncbi:MAG: protein O-mannosyl-transferase family [Candidatus Binataceae bacterium]